LISLKEFFPSFEEIHVLILGFADGFFWWRKRKYPVTIRAMLIKEPWYYRGGMVAGFMWFFLFLVLLGWLIVNLWF